MPLGTEQNSIEKMKIWDDNVSELVDDEKKIFVITCKQSL